MEGLSRISYFTKELKPVVEPVNLNEIINDLLMYNKTCSDKNIELKVRLSSDICDPGRPLQDKAGTYQYINQCSTCHVRWWNTYNRELHERKGWDAI